MLTPLYGLHCLHCLSNSIMIGQLEAVAAWPIGQYTDDTQLARAALGAVVDVGEKVDKVDTERRPLRVTEGKTGRGTTGRGNTSRGKTDRSEDGNDDDDDEATEVVRGANAFADAFAARAAALYGSHCMVGCGLGTAKALTVLLQQLPKEQRAQRGPVVADEAAAQAPGSAGNGPCVRGCAVGACFAQDLVAAAAAGGAAGAAGAAGAGGAAGT